MGWLPTAVRPADAPQARVAGRVGFLTAHIQTLEAERRALWRRREDPGIAQVRQLFTLRGIGVNSAWLYVMEFFAWQDFRRPSRWALAGLTPTP